MAHEHAQTTTQEHHAVDVRSHASSGGAPRSAEALHAATDEYPHATARRELGTTALDEPTEQLRLVGQPDQLDFVPRYHKVGDHTYNMHAAYNMFQTPNHTEWSGRASVQNVLEAHTKRHDTQDYTPQPGDWDRSYKGRHRASRFAAFVRRKQR